MMPCNVTQPWISLIMEKKHWLISKFRHYHIHPIVVKTLAHRCIMCMLNYVSLNVVSISVTFGLHSRNLTEFDLVLLRYIVRIP